MRIAKLAPLALLALAVGLFVGAFFARTQASELVEAHKGHSVSGHGWGVFLMGFAVAIHPFQFTFVALLGFIGVVANIGFAICAIRAPFDPEGAKGTMGWAVGCAIVATVAAVGTMSVGGMLPSFESFVDNPAIWIWLLSFAAAAASIFWLEKLDY